MKTTHATESTTQRRKTVPHGVVREPEDSRDLEPMKTTNAPVLPATRRRKTVPHDVVHGQLE